jgi:hypothetical protein
VTVGALGFMAKEGEERRFCRRGGGPFVAGVSWRGGGYPPRSTASLAATCCSGTGRPSGGALSLLALMRGEADRGA